VADSYDHLAKFPTKLEITHELAVAKSQACKIALFAGINPCFLRLILSLYQVQSQTKKASGNITIQHFFP
jgi:hypothetical protein